ncbi:MAG: sulfatase-like hydrolase/transferase [Myxococcales bacterium]|nr:sulfatase-like hydrolase/transferase [Myxococcales bacterium]
MTQKRLIFLLKLAVSVGIITIVYGKVMTRDGAAGLGARLSQMSWGWIAASAAMQLCAIAAAVTRWNVLLRGQGVRAPLRHLVGSFMIGRFFGAFTPGGLGLQGYKLYDIATQTGKTARATATVGIEMVLGQLSLSAVLIAGSVFGVRFLGISGVLIVNAFFLGLIAVAVTLLARPALFRLVADRLPPAIRTRLQTTIDAVCAYEGRSALVIASALLGMAVHAFNNLIYVCAARALGAELGLGEVFFASGLQIFATLLPLSINGIGLREVTAKALYTTVGVAESVALLIPTVGFIVEMAISSIGGLVFLARRVGYRVEIAIDDPEREDAANAHIERVAREDQPTVGAGLRVGLCAGMIGGALVGLGEAAVILASASGGADYSVLAYGAAAYAAICMPAAGGFGLALALSGQLMARRAVPEARASARIAALVVASFGLVLGAFRVRRDVFHEMLKWKSGQGLLVLLECLLAAGVTYLLLSLLLRLLLERRPAALLLRPAGLLALAVSLVVAGFSGADRAAAPSADATANNPAATPPPASASDVLFIVVDTLRADHLPLYGYDAIKTPALEAFARDAMVFEQAFSNASWTRPSFASLMTGRYPSSHQTTRKSSSLPAEIVTLAEAMQAAGYRTDGIVTNYNLAPFFNFQQGFDRYHYLEPEFVLGAGDTAAKLLLVQLSRQFIERRRAKNGQVARGSAYRDAEEVNREILAAFDRRKGGPGGGEPAYVFAGYMDPHDPYYPHPYDGTGYSRAANQKPDPKEAPTLRALYDGEIVFWDEHFGKLLAELKERGLYDAMTIVITSDHGEEFMDHGGFWHGTTLYDEQVHVPLLVKLPNNRRAGQRVDHWVEGVDIMPSILRQNGLQVPEGVQGKGLMQGSEQVFAEEDHEGNVLKALRIRRGGAEIKIIEANAGNPRGLEPYELYRLDQDPGEQVNLAHDRGAVLQVAATRLEEHGQIAQVGRVEKSEVELKANAAALQKLRALGYAGGEDAPKKN